MNLKANSNLNNGTYIIESILGQGGFGITYRARHARLNKVVAIKEFFPKALCVRNDDDSVSTATDVNSTLVDRLKRKFMKEAEHIATMDCPYIVRVTDVFEENGTVYYVMDYIDGMSLSEIVKKRGPLPAQKAVEYISKIGTALSYVHSKKMNHLDVKPANIMVRTADDTPILVDFGLSKQYDTEGIETSTTPVGLSHGYAPMEQYSEGGVKEFSPATDTYSLAATLYYALSGVIPPQATTLIDNDLTFPAEIPAELIPAISKAMMPKRSLRHQTVKEFVEQINHPEQNVVTPPLSEDTQLEATEIPTPNQPEPAQPTPPTVQPEQPEKKKSGCLKWLGIIFLVLLGIFVILVIIGDDPEEQQSDKTEHVSEAPRAPSQPTGEQNGHGFVDLGLPSGNMWGYSNLGSLKPEQPGEYFAWGETKSRTTFPAFRSKYQEDGITALESKRIIEGGRLVATCDAAHAIYGGAWRIPSSDDFKELMSKCEWTFLTYNDIKGYMVKGPNGNVIFLPFGGNITESGLNSVGESGNYWTSTPDGIAMRANFFVENPNKKGISQYSRSVGFNIRPIYNIKFRTEEPNTATKKASESKKPAKNKSAATTNTTKPKQNKKSPSSSKGNDNGASPNNTNGKEINWERAG